jgi:2,3,4,5-tetrahydropyridine-2,6-dicarboxylate N-succinyltransferase
VSESDPRDTAVRTVPDSHRRLQELIDAAYDRDEPDTRDARLAVSEAIALLDCGEARVAEKRGNEWLVNEWLKRAILLWFRQRAIETTEAGPFEYHDKLPLKTGYAGAGVRVVPPAVVRYGAHVEAGAVLMPSYVNIGARVGAGTMVDTWATVGSCAQVGRNVHVAGGVGIGGVLEPPGARPVVIEDDAFVASRCVVVEGVVVERGAVIGAGTVLTASTPVIDVTESEAITTKGRIPARAVVIPGTRPREFPAGTYQVPCALIIGRRSAATDRKVSLNEALRDYEVPV